ncbi:MAG TPA: efflux RND transporter periplasmic adaptor subunit [Terracidiphilus sp.]|nr:efflux RND transporter periplasmic adaptor subunit [Terracidiphilus sp.]
MSKSRFQKMFAIACVVAAGIAVSGCQKKPEAGAGGPAGPQALPVQTVTVSMSPVPQSSEYVATIKSRRSTTLMPQVSGQLTEIRVHSGEQVKAGTLLMQIDDRQQKATVDSLRATELQKKALNDYDTVEVDRQRKLFEAGVTSRDAYEQAQQAFENAKADYESAVEARKAGEQLLSYYTIRAPFDGVVGDIPVHVGDYVSPNQSPAAVLTTVDEVGQLEAYIYIPTERGGEVRPGLAVNLMDNNGKLLEKTHLDFVSPEVDSTLQGILVKAPVETKSGVLRNEQLVKADVIWSTKPMAVVPVLAVTRQGEESFVYVVKQQGPMTLAHRVSVVLGDTVGNNYSIVSGLNTGDRVIVSATQFLVDGMPVMLLPGGPPGGAPAQGPAGGPQSQTAPPPAANGNHDAARAAVYRPHRRHHHRARAMNKRHTRPATVS